MRYLKQSFKLFTNSFKFNKFFFYSLLSDALFYFLLAFTGFLLYEKTLDKVSIVSKIDMSILELPEIGMLAKSFMLSIYSFAILAGLLFLVFYGMFKLSAWTNSMEIRSPKKYMKNFSILSALWLLFWLIPFYLFLFYIRIQNTIIFFFIFLLINYLTKVLFISFFNSKGNIRRGFNTMIDISFKKFYMFFLPYFFELIVFLALFFIVFYSRIILLNLFYPIVGVAFLLYSAWVRKYFASVIESIKV